MHPRRRPLGRPRLRTAPRPAILLLGLACLALPARGDGSRTFSVNPSHSTDGVYQLEWTGPGPVRIDESTRPDFRDAVAIYEGRDRATTLSGRRDGLYHYRLVPLDRPGAPSGGGSGPPPIQVEVAHHPLSRALGFFALGLFVFLSTVGLVVFGDRRATPGPDAHDG